MNNNPTQSIDANVWLSTKVRVKTYLQMESAQDRDGIAKFIHDRFMERYITPLKAVPRGEENGFLMMASTCLLIEGLTAYRHGWEASSSCGPQSQCIDQNASPVRHSECRRTSTLA
jgi:hypothetical protein